MTSRPRLRAMTPLLVVSDLQRSIDFYVDKLGFTDANSWGEPPCFAMMHRDGLDLMLSRAEQPEHVAPHGRFGVWDLFLSVGDVAAERAALLAGGVAIDKGPTDTFYAMREIEILDPDGHRVCLAQDISGEALGNADSYVGTLDLGPKQLRLVLKVSRAGDGFVARLDSLDQNAMNLPIDRITIEGASMRFAMDAIGASFVGTLDTGCTRIDGRWTQRGSSWPLVFTKTV